MEREARYPPTPLGVARGGGYRPGKDPGLHPLYVRDRRPARPRARRSDTSGGLPGGRQAKRALDAADPRLYGRELVQVEAGLVGDAGVSHERHVGERDALAQQEVAVEERKLHAPERPSAP